MSRSRLSAGDSARARRWWALGAASLAVLTVGLEGKPRVQAPQDDAPAEC